MFVCVRACACARARTCSCACVHVSARALAGRAWFHASMQVFHASMQVYKCTSNADSCSRTRRMAQLFAELPPDELNGEILDAFNQLDSDGSGSLDMSPVLLSLPLPVFP
jgi:hypothetical protein